MVGHWYIPLFVVEPAPSEGSKQDSLAVTIQKRRGEENMNRIAMLCAMAVEEHL